MNLGWKLAQVVKGHSSETLLDSHHDERHPVAACVLRNTLAAVALRRPDDRSGAIREVVAELLAMDEPRRRFAAMMSGLDIRYGLGEGHPLLGRRMPDLDLITASGPVRVFSLLHDARPVLLNLGEPGIDVAMWTDRIKLIDARYQGAWELPVLGAVRAPTAVLIRPDGYVAWVGDGGRHGLADALATWLGTPAARYQIGAEVGGFRQQRAGACSAVSVAPGFFPEVALDRLAQIQLFGRLRTAPPDQRTAEEA